MVELIIYIAILVMVVGLVVQVLLLMTRSYLDFRVTRTLGHTAEVALERMSREIRSADDITDTSSTFGAHPGRLTLSTTDSVGAATTVEFYILNNDLYIKEGSQTGVIVVPPTVDVTSLIFRKITTAKSKGVKIEMTIRDARTNPAKVMKFYSTVGLRGSY